jgi:drug/metabolite transporter (DMT)-like permease
LTDHRQVSIATPPSNSSAGSGSYAVLAAAFSSLLVGLSVVGTREIVPRTDALLIAFLRYFPAGLCFLPMLWSRAAAIESRDWFSLGFLGFMFYGVYPWLFSAALKYTTALHGALVLPLLPMATLALGAMLRQEAIVARKLAGIALSIVGVGVAFAENFLNDTSVGSEAWKGDLLMVVCMLLSAVFNVLSRPHIIRYSALTVTAVTMPAGSVALALIVAFVARDQLLLLPSFTIADWSLVSFLSFGGAALANFLWIFALGRKAPSGVALFAMIPPLVAALLGAVILHEMPSPATIVGLSLVILGIVVANRESAA